MRHSPERVADVACGVFGIERVELYLRNQWGVRPRTKTDIRMRSLSVKCVRRLTGASLTRLASVFMLQGHSSIVNALQSSGTTDDEQADFDLKVIAKLQELYDSPQVTNHTDRDTRCDGVWFSPACRDER